MTLDEAIEVLLDPIWNDEKRKRAFDLICQKARLGDAVEKMPEGSGLLRGKKRPGWYFIQANGWSVLDDGCATPLEALQKAMEAGK